jgi:hypothetical protein
MKFGVRFRDNSNQQNTILVKLGSVTVILNIKGVNGFTPVISKLPGPARETLTLRPG